MNDVMYSRFDTFPPSLLNSNGSEDEDDDDENVLALCCPKKEESDDKSEEKSSKISDEKLVIKRRFSPLTKVAIAIVVTISLFVLLYNVFLPKAPDLFEQQHSLSPINSTKASLLLESICKSVHKKEMTGDICHWLCAKPRNFTMTGFYEGGSKKVLKLNMNGKDLVLKMHHPYAGEYDSVDPRVEDDEFTDKVLEIVNEQLKMDWPARYKNHLMKTLWPSYQENCTLTNAERQSLWALLQQEEFINFKTLSLTRVMPKVLGTCGHIYQVEYMIPFKMKAYYMNLKAKILVHLMGTLKLFYEFLNEPLQWCDVKFENLGLSAEYPRRFMVMDADMLYTDSKLKHILATRPCTTDDECNFFDCQSKCNNATGFCTPRTNDNVDIFCQKLINRLFGSFWSKANKYLSACHDKTVSAAQRLTNLRYIWAWSFVNV